MPYLYITDRNNNNNIKYLLQIESGFNIRTQSFEIKTLTPYKKGEQVRRRQGWQAQYTNISIGVY
jgi:hypothetical protein